MAKRKIKKVKMVFKPTNNKRNTVSHSVVFEEETSEVQREERIEDEHLPEELDFSERAVLGRLYQSND